MEKPKKEIKIEVETEIKNCSHMGCHSDATYKGTVTEKDIKEIKEDRQMIRHLFKVGTWYYCKSHKNIVGACCTHMRFEPI